MSYNFTKEEIAVDNAIWQIMDKGDKEKKKRLAKILRNRQKILKEMLKG